jgi:hypothetical protein
LWNSEKGFIAPEQNCRDVVVGGAYRNASREAKVAVKPRVEKGPSIDLYAELGHSRRLMVRARPQSKVR